MNIDTIPNTSKIAEITYTPRFSVICSIGKAPFYGEIEIVFYPADTLLEFESFEKWLFGIANDHMTVEDLTRKVFDILTDALGVIPMRVTVCAATTVHAPVRAVIERT